LLDDSDDERRKAWIKRFIGLRGLKELQSQLQTALTSIKSSPSDAKKKYVDQLLKLIRIFITASKEKADEEGQKEPEQPASKCKTDEPKDKAQEQKEEQIDSTVVADAPVTPKKPITRHLVAATSQLQIYSTADGELEVTEQSLFGEGAAKSSVVRPTGPCGICFEHLDRRCGGCVADDKPVEQCTVVTGVCGCVFHTHCSKAWTDKHGTCGGCAKPWGDAAVAKGQEKLVKRDPYDELRAVIFAEELDESILSQVEIPQLKEQTFDVATIYLSSENYDSEVHNLVEGALRMWEVLQYDEDTINIDPELLIQGLLRSKWLKTREFIKETLLRVCKKQKSMHEWVLMQFCVKETENFEVYVEERVAGQSTQFFTLFQDLIASVPDDAHLTAMKVLPVVSKRLRMHESSEKRGGLTGDRALHGLLTVIASCLEVCRKLKDDSNTRDYFKSEFKKVVREWLEADKLLDEFFYNCLFNRPSQEEHKDVKCCHSDSRKAAFKVLKEYVYFLDLKEMVDYL
jgi:hypothetical protein